MTLLNRQLLSDEAERRTRDIGLLVLRLAVGAVFVAHGWGDASQDGGAGANVENYRGAGIPVPELSAWFGAYMQLIGGFFVLFGAFTRLVSAGLAVVMAGALIFVHSGEPLVMGQDGSGSGFAFIMFAASITLLATGAGQFSIDRVVTDQQARTGSFANG